MKGSAAEGFQALYDGTGNSDAAICQKVHTKVTVDEELVRLCHLHGEKPYRGRRLGRLPELWPFEMLKRPLIEHAHKFVRQIGAQGFKPVTSVYEFQVWGPYTEKVGEIQSYVPEEGNHLIPPAQRRKAVRVWGYQGDEVRWDKGAAFLIVGEFTRAAKYGQVSEEEGKIIL
mgnify:FL=1